MFKMLNLGRQHKYHKTEHRTDWSKKADIKLNVETESGQQNGGQIHIVRKSNTVVQGSTPLQC
jgi:hypothetical protein